MIRQCGHRLQNRLFAGSLPTFRSYWDNCPPNTNTRLCPGLLERITSGVTCANGYVPTRTRSVRVQRSLGKDAANGSHTGKLSMSCTVQYHSNAQGEAMVARRAQVTCFRSCDSILAYWSTSPNCHRPATQDMHWDFQPCVWPRALRRCCCRSPDCHPVAGLRERPLFHMCLNSKQRLRDSCTRQGCRPLGRPSRMRRRHSIGPRSVEFPDQK